jgi:isochorismate pyruvate lyase
MKTPEACRNLEDIRVGIDKLDHEIIEALGRRLAYVKAAAQFKPTEESIGAPERVGAMVSQRRKWAISAGLDPDFVGPLFGQIIYWFIGQQVHHWRGQR